MVIVKRRICDNAGARITEGTMKSHTPQSKYIKINWIPKAMRDCITDV